MGEEGWETAVAAAVGVVPSRRGGGECGPIPAVRVGPQSPLRWGDGTPVTSARRGGTRAARPASLPDENLRPTSDQPAPRRGSPSRRRTAPASSPRTAARLRTDNTRSVFIPMRLWPRSSDPSRSRRLPIPEASTHLSWLLFRNQDLSLLVFRLRAVWRPQLRSRTTLLRLVQLVC